MLLTAGDLRAARSLLGDVARRTPVDSSRALAEALHGGEAPVDAALRTGDVLLKCENLQRTGSFKVRGAYVRIARLSAAERRHGVVAASAGNHAQGVALAARILGTAATVFMPHTVALPKLAATRAYGADVVLAGSTVDESLLAAREHAERAGAVLIHPFDHRDVVAGQGTVGLEIVEQCPTARTVLVCTGGGGLLAGIAVAVRDALPEARIVGVQAAGAAAWPASLAAGHPLSLTSMQTMADGIAVGRPGDVPFEHVRALVDEIVTVTDEDISRALLMLMERSKLVVEPAGGAAAAAVLAYPGRWEPPVVVTVSGGNVDPLLLTKVLQHGMAAAGRYLTVAVTVADEPGALAGLLRGLAGLGVNVLEVQHSRTEPWLTVTQAEVRLTLETRGADHIRAALASLREAGFRVRAVSGAP